MAALTVSCTVILNGTWKNARWPDNESPENLRPGGAGRVVPIGLATCSLAVFVGGIDNAYYDSRFGRKPDDPDVRMQGTSRLGDLERIKQMRTSSRGWTIEKHLAHLAGRGKGEPEWADAESRVPGLVRRSWACPRAGLEMAVSFPFRRALCNLSQEASWQRIISTHACDSITLLL
ncbi:unnamed protein product [Diplocarpon coronariae]